MKQRDVALSQYIPRYVLRAHIFCGKSVQLRLLLRQIVFAVIFEFAVFHTTPSDLSIIGALMIVSSAIYTTVIFPVSLLTDLLLTPAQLTKQKTSSKAASGTIPEQSAGGTSASDHDDDPEA